MKVWSFGGGVQSVAIGVLIKEGMLPKPELAGIADTGRERRTTWEYLERVLAPYLAPIGLSIERIPHTLASADLYSMGGELPLIPAYTRVVREEKTLWGVQEKTKDGRLPTFCSGWWKRDVFERWLRSKGVKECDCWIGFSVDERERVKGDHRPWCRYRHPLIKLGLSRADCVQIIQKAGLPVPSKSRCWCCPHQTDAEWAEVKEDAEEWAKAVALDEDIREADPEGEAGLFLYSGRVPLPLAQFGDQVTESKGSGIARPCQGESCWT